MEPRPIKVAGRTPVGHITVHEDTLQLRPRPWGYHLRFLTTVELSDHWAIMSLVGSMDAQVPNHGDMFAGRVETLEPRLLLDSGVFQLTLGVDIDDRLLHEYETQRLAQGAMP